MEKGYIRKCVCCNSDVTKIDGMPNDKPWDGMWADGIVEKISAGYGSIRDGHMFVLAICDSCVDIKRKAGVLQYVGDYMFPDETFYQYHNPQPQ